MTKGISRVGGRWRVRVSVGRDPLTGKRRWLSGYYATEAEAERQRARWLLDPAQAAKTRLGDYLRDEWLPDYQRRFAASSHRQRRVICETWLIPHLGHAPLGKLGARQIEQGLAAMARAGCSAKRQRQVLTVLGAALQTALRWGYLEKNPAAQVNPAPLTTQDGNVGTFSLDEVRRVVAASNGLYGMLWRVLAGSGMRLSEARALKWGDVDLPAGVIQVQRTLARGDEGEYEAAPKSAAGRRAVLLPAWLVRELRLWREQQLAEGLVRPEGYVLCRSDGSAIPSSAPYDQWKRTLAAAGVRYGKIHQLRHTASTEQLAAGVPLKTVSARLGHSTLRLTSDLYGHVGIDHQKAAADALEALDNESR